MRRLIAFLFRRRRPIVDREAEANETGTHDPYLEGLL
jgi:hypothetical protein